MGKRFSEEAIAVLAECFRDGWRVASNVIGKRFSEEAICGKHTVRHARSPGISITVALELNTIFLKNTLIRKRKKRRVNIEGITRRQYIRGKKCEKRQKRNPTCRIRTSDLRIGLR